MKRFLSLMVLVAGVLCAAVASAGHWETKEVFWQTSHQNGYGSTVIDTTHWVVAPAEVPDTTATFSTKFCAIPRGAGAPSGVGGAAAGLAFAQSDTATIGWLLFQSDSSATPTATVSSVTAIIDGRVGGFGPAVFARGWVKQDSILVNGAANGTLIVGAESFALPIRSISPYGNVFRWPELRCRLTAVTGQLSAVRVFWHYWME